ncbi:hypothetical protein [Rhodococcus jostii]
MNTLIAVTILAAITGTAAFAFIAAQAFRCGTDMTAKWRNCGR